MTGSRPGPNEATTGATDEPTAEDLAEEFRQLVEDHGRAEASRIWMARFSAYDSSAET